MLMRQQKENQLIYKRALEILSIFTEAAQMAKAKNKVEYKLEMDEATLAGLLKKHFLLKPMIKKLYPWQEKF